MRAVALEIMLEMFFGEYATAISSLVYSRPYDDRFCLCKHVYERGWPTETRNVTRCLGVT